MDTLNTLEFWENEGLVPVVEPDDFDRVGWERLIYSLPQLQAEVLVCKYLSLKPHQIVKILEFKNIGKYYNINFKLKDSYKKRKSKYLDYN